MIRSGWKGRSVTDSQRMEMQAIDQRMATLSRLFQQCQLRMARLALQVKTAEGRNPIANVMGSPRQRPADLYHHPIVDMLAITVTWRGRSRFLGNNYPLKLLERLARRPDQHLPMERLIRDVWRAPISDATFRSTVRGLKIRLRKQGMARLANAIRSSQRCYGLILDQVE